MQIRRQTSLIFRRYIRPRSVYFPFHSFTDLNNYLYFQIGSKRLTNYIDTNKASVDLLKQTLNNQKMANIKVGIITSEFDTLDFRSGYTNEVSAELNSDRISPDYLHLRAHFRRFVELEPFLFQWHFKFDKIIGETDSRIWMRNFKGIKDVGQKSYKNEKFMQNENENKLPAGDPLGHKTVIDLGVKLTSTDLPYFKFFDLKLSTWILRPFLFSNAIILPSDFKTGKSLFQNFKQNSVLGAGLGFQIIHRML